MIVYSNEWLRNGQIDTDICIIGSGPAGLTLARALDDGDRRIVLLEAGDQHFDDEIQSLAAGEIVGEDPGYSLQEARLRMLGGTSNHWTGQCHELNPIDFETRSWVPHSGWPISASDLADYYRQARQLIELPMLERLYDADMVPRADLIDNPSLYNLTQAPALDMDPQFFAINPLNFADAAMEDISTSESLTVVLRAPVLEFRADPALGRVSRAVVQLPDGVTSEVHAKHFILAAGAIESARILLTSNRDYPSGLANGNDLVGRFFQEHVFYPLGDLALVGGNACSPPWSGSDFDFVRRFSIAEKTQREGELLNAAFLLHSADADAVLRIPETGQQMLRYGRFPDDLPSRFLFALHAMAHPTQHAYCALNSTKPSPNVFNVQFGAEPVPNPNSRVTLSDRIDENGQRRASLDWRLSNDDVNNVANTVAWLERAVGVSGEGRIRRANWLFENSASPHSGSGQTGGQYHHMGTLRMSTSPKKGVVDADCRVHGLSNLHVAGSAVFPTAGYANPTLTIVALAFRLADQIRKIS